LKAIKKGFFTSWPGLTAAAVKKNFPESEETQKGHMRKMKSGICSTKREQTNSTTPQATEQQPRQTKKVKDIMVKLVDIQDELRQTVYTDQPGKFPTKSSKGNQYIMVIAELDSNAILFEPVRSKAAGDMVNAWQHTIDRLKKCGITPKYQVLDNEISAQYK